jgi:hypothetical protein
MLIIFLFLKNYYILEAPEILPVTFGAEVMNENDFAQTSCIVRKGDEPLTISWSFHGGDITHDLGIYTTPVGSRGSLLVIQSVGHKHGGNYTCTVKNAAGSRAQTVELKVNGKNNLGQQKLQEGKRLHSFRWRILFHNLRGCLVRFLSFYDLQY